MYANCLFQFLQGSSQRSVLRGTVVNVLCFQLGEPLIYISILMLLEIVKNNQKICLYITVSLKFKPL